MASNEDAEGAAFPDWEQAKLAIQETGGWIKNADTKITILASALAVSVTLAVPRVVDGTVSALQKGGGLLCLWSVICSLALVAAVLTGACVFIALSPRTQEGAVPVNRFAWPALARLPFATLPPIRSASDIRREAWEQAKTLAQIATQKLFYFRAALIVFTVYLVVLAALLILGVGLT